jgi:CheY-like chemotaxis protein
MLVEADRALREWCRLHLAAKDLTVMAFADARQALEAARRQPPDLLIVAADLPEGQAFALANAVRSYDTHGSTPILFLIPGADTVAKARAGSFDQAGAITKPFKPDVLLAAAASRLTVASAAATARSPFTPGHRSPAPPRSWHVADSPAGAIVDARLATVLVVAVGSWVRTAGVGPAEFGRALIDRCSRAASSAVRAQGGVLVEQDGDRIIAWFGDYAGEPAQAIRALRAALGIAAVARSVTRSIQGTLPAADRSQVPMGCGIQAGSVTLARLSVRDSFVYSIAGPAYDQAQELAERAKALGWAIAVSDRVLGAAGPTIRLGRKDKLLARSNQDLAIPMSEVLGLDTGAFKPQGAVHALPPQAVAVTAFPRHSQALVDRSAGPKTAESVQQPAPEAGPPPRVPSRRLTHLVFRSRLSSSYEAEHRLSGRREFVRTLSLNAVPEPLVRHCLDEYCRLSRAEQRNVVTILEVEQVNGLAYVVLEHLTGGSLAQAVQRGMSVGAALDCLAQMSMALDALHGEGVVHGALCAEDFLFREDRVIVLAGLGVTRRAMEWWRLQQSGAGGARRARPMGNLPRKAMPRQDFAALGSILFAMLTGTAPRRGNETGSPLLPGALAGLQPLLDRLLGIGHRPPLTDGGDVIMELLRYRDTFPFTGAAWDGRSAVRATASRA